MIRDDLWFRAMKRTGRLAKSNPGRPMLYSPSTGRFVREESCPRCGFAYDGRTGRAFVQGEHCPGCADLRGAKSNPQLQLLGNPRRNEALATVRSPEEVDRAVNKFHGASTGRLVHQYTVDDGEPGQTEIDLAYLGDVPAVSWFSGVSGSRKHSIEVEGEKVEFNGFRTLFRGESMPILALWIDRSVPVNDRLAVMVGGNVERLRDQCDSNGVLGAAPVVEYVVEKLANSNKAKDWFVHQFEPNAEPVLRWNDGINGLVYERDRSVAGAKLNPPGGRAVYKVTDWFHETQPHGSRR